MKTFLANPTATVLYRYGNSFSTGSRDVEEARACSHACSLPMQELEFQDPKKGGASRPRQVARVVFGLDHGTANEQETKQPRIRRTAHLQWRGRVWGDGGAANGTEKLFTGSSDM